MKGVYTIRSLADVDRIASEFRHVSKTGKCAATLSDGRTLEVDLVIVGIGVNPSVGLASTAELTIENGIKTNVVGNSTCENTFVP